MFVSSTFLIYNSRWFWFLFSVTASVLYSVDDLHDPCEQNCPWKSKNWLWLPIWRSGFGFMFKFFSKLVMNGRRFKISIYSIKKVLNNDEILHHRTKSNSSGAFGLLGVIIYNLKITTGFWGKIFESVKAYAAVKMNGKNLPWDTDADINESKEDWVTYNKYSHLYKDLWGIEVQRDIVPNTDAREKYPRVTLGALWIGGI